MNVKKRVVMDVDYYDLARRGYGPEELKAMFEKCACAGVDAMFWSVAFGGHILYQGKTQPVYTGQDHTIGSAQAAAVINSFDPLATAIELGHQHGIKIIPYFRMFDDFFSGMIDKTIDRMEQGWWESRCGNIKLKGWPCYHEPEVIEHKLRNVREIIEYGVDGFLFGLSRSHAFYHSPYRQPNLFGYNQPVADEYQRRYGVDIRKFDYMTGNLTTEGHFKECFFVHEFNYVGAEEFDLAKWHMIKGEAAVNFIRLVRQLMGPEADFSVLLGTYGCQGMAELSDRSSAQFRVDPAAMLEEGIMNEWVIPGNFHDQQLDFLPTEYTNKSNIWLNDIISLDGGHNGKYRSPKEIRAYLERVTDTSHASITIHEADFIEMQDNSYEIWEVVKEFFGK